MAKLPRDTITHYEHDGKGNINITITDLIRCKDCKYWFDVLVDFPIYDGYKSCDKDGLVRHKSFFCANGKLRGDSE